MIFASLSWTVLAVENAIPSNNNSILSPATGLVAPAVELNVALIVLVVSDAFQPPAVNTVVVFSANVGAAGAAVSTK